MQDQVLVDQDLTLVVLDQSMNMNQAVEPAQDHAERRVQDHAAVDQDQGSQVLEVVQDQVPADLGQVQDQEERGGQVEDQEVHVQDLELQVEVGDPGGPVQDQVHADPSQVQDQVVRGGQVLKQDTGVQDPEVHGVVVQDQVLLPDQIQVQDQTPATDNVGSVPTGPDVQHLAGRTCKRKRGRSFRLKPPVYAPIDRDRLTLAISRIRSRLISFKEFDKTDLSILFWTESAPTKVESQDTTHIDEEDDIHTLSGTCQDDVDIDQDKKKIEPESEPQVDQPEDVKKINKYMLGLRQLNTRHSDPKISRRGRKSSSTHTSGNRKSNKILTTPSVAAENITRDIRSYFSGKVESTHMRGKVRRAAGGDINQTGKLDKITGD